MTKELQFNFQKEQKIFLFSTTARSALGPTQPPLQGVLGSLFLWVKCPGHKAYHLPLSVAEVEICGAIPPLPHTSWCGAQLSIGTTLHLALGGIPV
jgi:hypothetical protein